MKKVRGTLAAVCMLFSLIMLDGCARQGMNDTMDSAKDTVSGEKMDPGMGSMQEEIKPGKMENMQNKEMEKSMDKTVE